VGNSLRVYSGRWRSRTDFRDSATEKQQQRYAVTAVSWLALDAFDFSTDFAFVDCDGVWHLDFAIALTSRRVWPTWIGAFYLVAADRYGRRIPLIVKFCILLIEVLSGLAPNTGHFCIALTLRHRNGRRWGVGAS